MREHSGQPEDNLTFSTLTFHSNYDLYVEQVMPIFNEYETVLVVHETGMAERLPFRPRKSFATATTPGWSIGILWTC